MILTYGHLRFCNNSAITSATMSAGFYYSDRGGGGGGP
jgi:hypothetical protein